MRPPQLKRSPYRNEFSLLQQEESRFSPRRLVPGASARAQRESITGNGSFVQNRLMAREKSHALLAKGRHRSDDICSEQVCARKVSRR